MLPIVIGGALLLVAIALVIYAISNNGQAQAVKGISCDKGEQLAVHYHAHLDIEYQGNPVSVPAQIGIPSDKNCIYWLHTHDTTGTIHIEAPAAQQSRIFTLGDFFSVWNQPLSSTQVTTIKLAPGEKVVAYVDGKPYSGDPNTIPLRSHTQVVLEIQPPVVDPPPTYTFPAGL